MNKKKLKLICSAFLIGCSLLGCSNKKEEKVIEGVATAFVQNYYTYETDPEISVKVILEPFRELYKNFRTDVYENNPFIQGFDDSPVVSTVKIEFIEPSIVQLGAWSDDYYLGSTNERFKGSLPIYDTIYSKSVLFYGYEVMKIKNENGNGILRGIGEFKYGDTLELDIPANTPGYYKAYDVTLRWGYENPEMNSSDLEFCYVNRIVLRIAYVDSQWQIVATGTPSDGKFCTQII